MSNDIVERLRARADGTDTWSGEGDYELHRAAADEVERLRDELADWQRTVRAHDAETERLRAENDEMLHLLARVHLDWQIDCNKQVLTIPMKRIDHFLETLSD